MNRGKYGRMTLLVVLATVLALVLQGCGGDGDNSVEQDLRDQVAMLEVQLSDSETAKAAAETAAADAMAAQTAAEAERDAANTAKGAAEQAATTAIAAQTAAGMAQAEAEAAQATAEAAQIAAQTAQATAETDRGAAMAAQMAAEAAKATAEAAQVAAAAAQATAEAERDAAMAAQTAAMEAQATAEAAQTAAQQAAATAMAAQAAAEAERDTNAAALVAAEAARNAAKDAEAAAKVAQAQAEAAQATAEADSADAMAAQATAEQAAADAMAAQATAEQAAADAMAAQATAEQAAADAMAAQMAADTNAADYKMMAEDAEAARMEAVDAQKDAEDKAAEYKKMAEDAEAARMEAVEARKDADKKAQMYKDERDRLQAQLEGRDVDSDIDMAKKLNDALKGGGVEAYTDADDDLEAMVRNMAVQPRTVTASIEGELSVTLEHVTIDDNDTDPSDDGRESGARLTSYDDKADVPAEDEIDDWRGLILTNDDANAMAVVYSNIVDTRGGRFDNRYSATLSSGVKRYEVDGATTGNIPWSNVRRDTTATTITDKGAAGDTVEDVHTFAGSVHDVSGDFSCMGQLSTCVPVIRLSDGKVTEPASGTWNFTPTDPDATISTVIDDKFLTFGWWLDRGDGTEPYYFDAFAAATGMSKNGDDADTTAVETDRLSDTVVSSLQGTGTYEGAAAGKYTILDANADTAEGGHFTASAMLEANFNAATDEAAVSPNTDGVAITGTIGDFMTGATARPGWEVELMAGDTDDATDGMQNYDDLNVGVMGSTEWTMGGAAAPATGGWMADVYDGGANDFPDAMTGTFNASGTIGRISGAFGVEEK